MPNLPTNPWSKAFAKGGRTSTEDNGVIPALMSRVRSGLSDYGSEVAQRARTLRDQPIATLNTLGQDVIRQLQTPEGALDVAMNAPMTPLAGLAGVIKNKGGNWLTGSVEGALAGLKKQASRFENPNLTSEEVAQINSSPINNWIDKPLTRYVKNEMATPEDPLRALAERGVLHSPVTQTQGGVTSYSPASKVREWAKTIGSPSDRLGVSDLAKTWEDAADSAIDQNKIGSLPAFRKQPWMTGVTGDTIVNDMRGDALSIPRNLGFNHLIDELSNAINPESGLPRHLQFPADRLDKVSVPQAVERVDAINKWRAALKAEADQAKANNAATVIHKEYPENNPKGLKWVELKANDTLPEGHTLGNPSGYPNRFAVLDPSGQSVKGTIANSAEEAKSLFAKGPLSDALKYEGDTMGHCVGGYCDDVASGRSRIYSLRDAKGQPHTTIEVQPGDLRETLINTLDPEGSYATSLHDRVNRLREGNGDYDEVAKQVAERFGVVPTPRIIQIKGKGNLKPADEYQPFVQDFVKSGKWSDVGDLQNAGLTKTAQGYFTQAELDDMVKNAVSGGELPKFAQGGSVTNKIETPEQLRAIIRDIQSRR